MKNFLRELVVSAGPTFLPSSLFLEKLLSISVMTRNFRSVFGVKRFSTREQMWEHGMAEFLSSPLVYLEFGVWKGESIAHVAKLCSHQNSEFYGFDSFEGLPEAWDTMSGVNKKGLFSVGGNIPKIEDSRVKFVSGWFQNTVPQFIDGFRAKQSNKPLVVHFDADLYSSTLFCLMQVDRLKQRYLAIFDEFPGHETRALYNYLQSTGAKVDFVGRVGPSSRYPWQVMAWISPAQEFIV